MEDTVALELSVDELAFKPRTIKEDLPPSTLRAVPLEGALVEGAVRPSLPPPALGDAVDPLPGVGGTIRALNTTLPVHPPVQPLTNEDLAGRRLDKSARALALALRELACVVVPACPLALAGSMQDIRLELASVDLAGGSGQLTLAPHHVLPPMPDIPTTIWPYPLPSAVEATVAKFAPILLPIRGPVGPLPMHTTVRPLSDVGAPIRKSSVPRPPAR
mmetsp:Transcript_80819/g.203212  ORF Transcript_80819/g.203212 Transcript_80819/m.203212 type:complete len:218 (+) Transcript_80819:1858-2511(+)